MEHRRRNCAFHLFAIYIEEAFVATDMCGRYSLFAPQETLEQRFDVTVGSGFEPRYNAAPGQELPVITDAEQNSFRYLTWGLIPQWVDDATERYINARSESVKEKPAFAKPYESRRCLVPADGFYEWADAGSGTQPYRVAFEDDRPFAMAGLWERWTPQTIQTGLDDFTSGVGNQSSADPIETFTVLTTTSNEVIEPLHHRMAVILSPGEEDAWLNGADVSFEPMNAQGFQSYPVSTAVNNPANDSPELLEPADI